MQKVVLKKIIVVMLVFFLFSTLALAGSKAIGEGNSAQIKVTMQSQEPDPVRPGEIAKVKFKIESAGRGTTKNAVVRFLPKYPLSLYRGQADRDIGVLRAISTGSDSVVVEYEIKVAEDAVQGKIGIDLEVHVGEGAIVFKDDEFTLDVQTNDPILEITSVTLQPEHVPPGSTADIQIFAKNFGDSLLRDITFSLDFDNDDLPLAPYQSTSQRRIAQIPANNQLPLTFRVVAEPDAIPGLYKVPLKITYSDETGDNFTINDLLAIFVGDVPKLKPYIKKSTVQEAGKPGKVTIELANTGTTDVKFVEITVLPSDDFELVTPSNYVYIGDVDSDDTESEEFDLFVNKKLDSLIIPLQVNYHDANNKLYQEKIDLTMKLYSSSQLKKFGVIAGNGKGIWVFVLLLLGGGFFYYKKYYKKKR